MSAAVCVDIAGAVLSDNRPAHQPGSDPRVLVIAPYRPQAQLLSVMLKDDKLAGEVAAGTAHMFQGAEADIVILDLVNDTPHWRVGHFIPKHDDQTQRLFNVAITRAKQRLIVVGDFEYCQKQASKAFLGRALLPFLLARYRRVHAIEVVPKGLAGRAAEARLWVSGGSVEPRAERLLVKQDRFYQVLAADLSRATERVVIYSPFITQDRLAQMETHLRAAREKGAVVVVVTKTREERSASERQQYRANEEALSTWGARIVHKRGMHEKLVLIDRDIVWVGSLNPLSFRNTQEIMERRCSSLVFDDYSKALRLDELITECDEGSRTCPICGCEVVASEGSSEPYFWRCGSNDCPYRRSIDQPPLRGGAVQCKHCQADVEFGEAGDRFVWICKENKRHRQRILPMHLLLPLMKSLIPAKKLRRVERELKSAPKKKPSQGRLFQD